MRLQFVCFHDFLLSRIKNDFYLTPISTLLNFTRAINFDNPFGSHIDQLYNLKVETRNDIINIILGSIIVRVTFLR